MLGMESSRCGDLSMLIGNGHELQSNPAGTTKGALLDNARVQKRSHQGRAGLLKVVLALVVAIDASLIAWLAQSYQTTSRILAVFGFVGVVFISAAVVWINRAAMRLFNLLEEE